MSRRGTLDQFISGDAGCDSAKFAKFLRHVLPELEHLQTDARIFFEFPSVREVLAVNPAQHPPRILDLPDDPVHINHRAMSLAHSAIAFMRIFNDCLDVYGGEAASTMVNSCRHLEGEVVALVAPLQPAIHRWSREYEDEMVENLERAKEEGTHVRGRDGYVRNL